MIQIIEKSMKKWYYILVKNKLYRLEKKMIDKEEIKKVSDTIEIVKSNIEEYEILYSNLLKGNADEQYIQNMNHQKLFLNIHLLNLVLQYLLFYLLH